MMSKEDFFKILTQQLQHSNLRLMTQKIVNQHRFDPSLVDDLEPNKNLICEIIEYILLRENATRFKDVEEEEILNLQARLSKQLSIPNFDFMEDETSKSKIFIQRIVLLSLLLPSITDKMNFSFLTSIDPRELFIVLLFLASGKLVSIRTFELARERMRKRIFLRDNFSTFTTIQTIVSSKRKKNVHIQSDFIQFKEELKSALSVEKPSLKKQHKTKPLLRRNAGHFITKVTGSYKFQVIEPLNDDTQKGIEKNVFTGKVNSVSYNGRISLDKVLMRQHVKSVCNSLDKNKAHIFVINKPTRYPSRFSREPAKRTHSMNLNL